LHGGVHALTAIWGRIGHGTTALTDKLKDFFVGSTRRGQVRYLNFTGMVIWGIAVAALGVALFSAIVNLWAVVDVTPPASANAPAATAIADQPHKVTFVWGLFSLHLSKTTGLMVMAAVAGALGGWTTAIRLFAFWAGERKLKATWPWWFGNRVLGGAALALIVYLLIRAGLFGSESATGDVNPYGTAAFAALVGLFTRQAMTKLQAVFDTLFQTVAADGEEEAGEAAELDQGQPSVQDIKESRKEKQVPAQEEGHERRGRRSGKAGQTGSESGR
jgi:hypothetical protein